MFIIPWDVKETTRYSQRVEGGVPGVVAVLCDCIFRRVGAINLEPRSVVLSIPQ